MNRADLLLSVLQDGREHSREDIVGKVGFFLTNNAASELRARGINVTHRVRDGLHVYSLSAATGDPLGPSPHPVAALNELAESSPNPNVADGAPTCPLRDSDAGQLVLQIPRSAYEAAA